MRSYEQPDSLLPNTFIVVRIDGRGFTKYVPVFCIRSIPVTRHNHRPIHRHIHICFCFLLLSAALCPSLLGSLYAGSGTRYSLVM